MISEVYDLEVLSNLFTYTGYSRTEDKWYQFVIHYSRNELEDLYKHLFRDKLVMTGFNNENYDYPILHHIINHFDEYKYKNGAEIAQALYQKSQNIINEEFTAISDKNKYIQQIDLFRIWHYNNAARKTSLKQLEFAMKMDSIEDMPIHHSTWCTEKDIDLILSYNKHDVLATSMFLDVSLGNTEYSLYKNKNKIELRTQIQSLFNFECINFPDVKIGEQLLLELYCRQTGKDKWAVSKLRTHRNEIKLKDCIPSWCNIKSKQFNEFLDLVKNTTILGTVEKGSFAKSIMFHGIKFDFGLGGTHACCKPGIYESNDKYIIIDLDVASLYPSIAKSLSLYPEHLGPEFIQLYSMFIDRRIEEKEKPKKERNNVLIEGYKLILNGVYGKSNEPTSFLYDPLYTFRTTIAGQLFICMWSEKLVEKIPELEFIQVNTDGITIRVPRNKQHLIKEVSDELTELTSLIIEDNYYNKMVIRDVNSYSAQYLDKSSIKHKGCFEIDKEYHKDSSMRIVPYALEKYYFENIPVADTIKNHKDIYDFCLRFRVNKCDDAIFKTLVDNEITESSLSQTTRYFVSNQGGILLKKINKSKKINGINVGFSITPFNVYENKNMEDYDINYNFYIKECNKIINSVDCGQLTLF